MVRLMNPGWISIGAAAVALSGGLWFWTTRPASFAPSATTPVAAERDALREELAAERDTRLGLEAEVAMLRLLLDDFAGGARLAPSPGAAAPPATDPTTATQSPPEPMVANTAEQLWFDSPALREHGISEQESARLERLFEESELQVLYLRDQSMREGWAGTPRFLQAMHDMRSSLRESVGDESFDWLLYATRRPNRVVVRAVLSTGPAAQAGIQAGDMIVRYDDRAIFKGRELQQATTKGEAGRIIGVDLISGSGQLRRVTVPSGPLGLQFAEERHPPQSSR
jgi:hypothetical protein